VALLRDLFWVRGGSQFVARRNPRVASIRGRKNTAEKSFNREGTKGEEDTKGLVRWVALRFEIADAKRRNARIFPCADAGRAETETSKTMWRR